MQRNASGNAKVEEVRKLSTLLEVSQALSGTLDLRAALQRVLEILERRHSLERGFVALAAEGSTRIDVEASTGFDGPGRRRLSTIDGVTREVVASGRAVVIARASLEPLLASLFEGTHERTYISVPITVNRRTTGALSVELSYRRDRDYDRAARFLAVVASAIAQAVKMHRLVEAERQRLVEENIHLREELRERYDFSNIIGNSGPMRQVYEQVTQVARTNTTVLIRGESGTGKELIAHAIHYNSLRAKKQFIKVSCAALPETLIESELFGYEKGAFTGAESRRKGRFELAEGGTIFLDEVGELNPATQVKLLRVLQEREFERLGGTNTVRVNVRVIAATNRDLERAIRDGQFREDLYYRLNVFSIFAPPLRERKADVMLLADHFLRKYASEHGRRIKRISTPAIDMLTSYHWPGNARELENTIERAVLVCDGDVVHGHHLPPALQTAEASGTVLNRSLAESLESFEKDLIQDALKTTRGNCAKAARLLSTTERIFNYKVHKYGIDPRRFRG
jgi:Nif-specific regulatory protein